MPRCRGNKSQRRCCSNGSRGADELREFFIQMWLQNPALARQGGASLREIITPLELQSWPDVLR